MNAPDTEQTSGPNNQNHGAFVSRIPLTARHRPLTAIVTVAILCLVALASGLSDFRFAPAQPLNFGTGEIRPVQDTLAEIAHQFQAIPAWQQILLAGSFAAVIVLALIFMSPEMRKRLLRIVLRVGLTAIAILYFFNNFHLDDNRVMPADVIAPLGEIEAAPPVAAEPQIFEPEPPNPLWGYLITVGVVTAVGALGWGLWRVLARDDVQTTNELEAFARIARDSLDDLADGAEWQDVIVRSYVQMGAVIKERRGIARDTDLTPREFARRLIEAGLPRKPVERLTRLFERVRYSTHTADEREVAEALGCLNEIAATFGEKLHG